MLNICTIGIGNAGNQISELAYSEKNIPGIAINSSQKDLTNIKSIGKIIVGDERGAGKNRSEAKRFVREQISSLLGEETFVNHISVHDVIFVISSIGGGTGSGMVPMMTDIMMRKFPDKQFVLVEIYPPVMESLAAQQNAIDYLKEVRQFLPNATYMCYDNNRKAHLPTHEMMKAVNREVVEGLSIIRGDCLYPTPYNSIDEKDMLRILETSGRLAVYQTPGIKEKDLDDKSIEDIILNVIKNDSSNVELDRDKIVKRMGLITNLNDTLTQMFCTDVAKIKGLVGEPVEGFEHIYVGQKDEENKVAVVLSGLSVPDDRLEKVSQRIEEGLAELARVKESSILDNVSTEDIRGLRDSDMKTSNECDLDEIFKKYN